MSKIGERLQRLHKTSNPIGFGFAAAVASPRRMLLIVCVGGEGAGGQVQEVSALADAIVTAGEPIRDDSGGVLQFGGIPLGVWLVPGQALSGIASDAEVDFVISDLNGPSALVSHDKLGRLVVVDADLEASRLRAIADLGVDALVLRASEVNPGQFSSIVDCRRAHSITGKPLVCLLDGVITSEEVTSLWRAGVDALMIDADRGAEELRATHEAICGACYEARRTDAGPVVSIGRMSTSEDSGREEDDEGDGEDDDYE